MKTGGYPQPSNFVWGLQLVGVYSLIHTMGWGFLEKKFLENLVGMVKMFYLWWVGGLLVIILSSFTCN